MPRLLVHLTLWAAATLALHPAAAQTGAGRLMGEVVRSSGGVPVPGANVILIGTLYGTVTDQAGRFDLGVIRPGSYVLRVSMTGLIPVERALTVPADLGEPIVVELREARAELFREPLAATEEAFRAMVAVPSRGDPYLADASIRWRRVAGLRQRRFATAYSGPIVRALSGNRTGAGSARSSGRLLPLPGVGMLDFEPIAESGMASFVIPDPVGGVSAAGSYVGLSRDHRGPTDGPPLRDRALVDLGYQSNLNAFSSGITTAGASPRVRTVAAARYTAGRDFASAADEEWGGGFRQGGVVVNVEASPTRESTVTLGGRMAGIGNVDLPGTGLEMDRASHADLSAGWTAVPEGSRIRRADVSIAWGQSSADLGGVAAPRDWSRMAADESRLLATAAADVHTGAFDRLQAGVTASSRKFDWRGTTAAGVLVAPVEVRIDADRVRVSPFLSAAIEADGFQFTFAGRLDATRTRLAEVAPGVPDASWTASPGAAVAVSFNPDRHWRLSLTLSTLALEPALTAVSSSEIPTPDRLPAVPVEGNPDLQPERLFFAGARVTRIRGAQEVSFGAFLMSISRYVTPRVAGTGRYSYANTDATLAGFEVTGGRDLLPFVRVSGFLAFAWGRNRTIGEPLPLVYPLNGRIDLTASAARGRLLIEISTEFAARQNRVATSLAERRSDGYAAFHMWLGIPVTHRFGLRTGVYNMFNARFAPHENVFVEDRNARLPAPGRAWVLSGRFRF